MLDNWEENLAMITANRTKDDELVLIHLGDCLWKETSNVNVTYYTLILLKHTTVNLLISGCNSVMNDLVYCSPHLLLSC